MKKIVFSLLFITLSSLLHANNNYSTQIFSIGGGYLGETITHPGLFLQTEYQQPFSPRWSFFKRFEAGYYFHKRSHQAVLTLFEAGLRYHTNSRLHLGGYASAGGLFRWNHSNGEPVGFAGAYPLLSTGFEIGIRVAKKKDNYIFLRPSYLWQLNTNQKTLEHIALEVGFSLKLNRYSER